MQGQQHSMANYERSPKGQVRRPPRPEHVVAFEFLRAYYDEDDSDDGALQKSDVYDEYQNYCKQHGHKPLVAADFGRVLKSVFPASRDRRLGSRGSSKYCYVGVKRRNSRRSPLPSAARPREPVTDAELCRAYEVVICEWASTVLSRRMNSLQELATYLLGQRFVPTRSCSALTIMSAHKDSIDRLNFEAPLNKHRETQLKLQEKLMQRMAQRRELLPSSSSPGSSAAGDATATASPAFSPAVLPPHDGLTSGCSSPVSHAAPALATRTNTAPSSCRSTPVPPSSCDSSARSTPMGGLSNNDVFHPSAVTGLASFASSVQQRPADARFGHGSTASSGSLAEALAAAWADSNSGFGGNSMVGSSGGGGCSGAPVSGRWVAVGSGCERQWQPAAAAARMNGVGGSSAGFSGSRLMVRSEPCTPTPWHRGSGGRFDDGLLLSRDHFHVSAGSGAFGQISSRSGFQPLRLNDWAEGIDGSCAGSHMGSCPCSTVCSPVPNATPAGHSQMYDMTAAVTADAAEAESMCTNGAGGGSSSHVGMTLSTDGFQVSSAVEHDGLMSHLYARADDRGVADLAGNLPPSDSDTAACGSSSGAGCGIVVAANTELVSLTSANSCSSGAATAAATSGGSCGGLYGLFDNRHASAFVPVGRSLAKMPGCSDLLAAVDADAAFRHGEPAKEAADAAVDPVVSIGSVADGETSVELQDDTDDGSDNASLVTGAPSNDSSAVQLNLPSIGNLHSADDDFADILSIIGFTAADGRAATGEPLQSWQLQQQLLPQQQQQLLQLHVPPQHVSSTCSTVYQHPNADAAAAAANQEGGYAGLCSASAVDNETAGVCPSMVSASAAPPCDHQSANIVLNRPLHISIRHSSMSQPADSTHLAALSRQTSCVQVKSTDTPPVTPTGNFRPVITPNTELRRWCNGGSGWPGPHGSTTDGSDSHCTTPVPPPLLLPLPASVPDAEKGCGYQGFAGYGPSGAMSPPLHPPKKRKHLSGDASLLVPSSSAAPSLRTFATGLATVQQPPSLALSQSSASRHLLVDDRAAAAASCSSANNGIASLRTSTLRELLLANTGSRAPTSAAAAAAVTSTVAGVSGAATVEGSLRLIAGGGHDFAARRNLTEALLSPPCDLMAGNQASASAHSQSNSRAGASSSLSMPTPPSSKASTPDRFV